MVNQMSEADLLWLLLARQNGRCFICGGEWNLEIHHLIPKASGGVNHPYNCLLLCGPVWDERSCHFKVTNSSMERYKEYRKYVCNGWTKWFKLKRIVSEIKAREKEKAKWSYLK